DIATGLDPPGTGGDRRQAGPAPQDMEALDLIARLRIRLARITRGSCGHEHQEDQYPAQPRAPAPGPGPQSLVHRPRLRQPRRLLRPGPHQALAQKRNHLRVQPQPDA
ncbi:MAG TPA: hypothetical protein VN969_29790, partial [Streptosporangiaceae bacterium]|nr:hypothetical protein [Streptosporangiaceae bacterium]